MFNTHQIVIEGQIVTAARPKGWALLPITEDFINGELQTAAMLDQVSGEEPMPEEMNHIFAEISQEALE
jgi:hypothetical protein